MANKFEIVSVTPGNGDIVIWKLGNADKGILPTAEDLENFRKLLVSEKIGSTATTRKWWHFWSARETLHVVVPNIVDIAVIRINP